MSMRRETAKNSDKVKIVHNEADFLSGTIFGVCST
jgi:hypothetical protein